MIDVAAMEVTVHNMFSMIKTGKFGFSPLKQEWGTCGFPDDVQQHLWSLVMDYTGERAADGNWSPATSGAPWVACPYRKVARCRGGENLCAFNHNAKDGTWEATGPGGGKRNLSTFKWNTSHYYVSQVFSHCLKIQIKPLYSHSHLKTAE